MTAIEYPQAILTALRTVGMPYLLGSKWPLGCLPENLRGPVDCSGFARWVLYFDGVNLPDGSYEQIKVCTKLPASMQQNPRPLDLGFFAADGKDVDHVVVSCGNGAVIEARGNPHNQVILRPVSAWLAQPGFLGFYAVPGNEVRG